MAILEGLLGSLELPASGTKDIARRRVFLDYAQTLAELGHSSAPDRCDQRRVEDRSARLIAALLGALLHGESPTPQTRTGVAGVARGLLLAFARPGLRRGPPLHRPPETL